MGTEWESIGKFVVYPTIWQSSKKNESLSRNNGDEQNIHTWKSWNMLGAVLGVYSKQYETHTYIYLENPTLQNFRHGLKSTQKKSSQRKKGIGSKKRNCWVHTSFLPARFFQANPKLLDLMNAWDCLALRHRRRPQEG